MRDIIVQSRRAREVRHEDGEPSAHRGHDRAIWPHSFAHPGGVIGGTTCNPDKAGEMA
jgi:hypothetical protein